MAEVTATLAALERCQRLLADASDEDRAFVREHLEALAARLDAEAGMRADGP